MKKNPQLYVMHIVEAITHIEEYAGNDYDIFCKDKKTYDAVLHNLQTMAESTKRLPEEMKQRHPEINWRDIAGFLNILVHDYLEGINEARIWKVITKYLPPLKQAMMNENIVTPKD